MKLRQYPGTEILAVEIQFENQNHSLQQLTNKENSFTNKPSVTQTTSRTDSNPSFEENEGYTPFCKHIWTQWRGNETTQLFHPFPLCHLNHLAQKLDSSL